MSTIPLPHVISDFLRDGIAKPDCEWVLTERNQWFLENSNTGVWVVRIRMNWDGLVELTHARISPRGWWRTLALPWRP